ncbi:MAG: hypothetical protein CBD21_04420 [bacterium TMED161]|nr:MAG: hypothetical protein CBD21_04420 [bacterium TMED161]|tara:strand:+ start:699 stop:1046 length:348 start_codon:yes stop_codon:yes gene_type:complete
MCLGGSVGRMTPPQREYQNRPVTVSGSQTGVDDAKDTKKATESLKIKRQKEEGTYVDPNLTTAEKLTRSGGGNKTAQQKANLARNRQKAKNMATARLRSKYSKGITGRKSKSRTA